MKVLAHIAPLLFLKEMGKHINSSVIKDGVFREAIMNATELASQELCNIYFGDMCPGYFDVLKDDKKLCISEYNKFFKASKGILKWFYAETCTLRIRDILDTFKSFSEDWILDVAQDYDINPVSPNQLELPFEFEESSHSGTEELSPSASRTPSKK